MIIISLTDLQIMDLPSIILRPAFIPLRRRSRSQTVETSGDTAMFWNGRCLIGAMFFCGCGHFVTLTTIYNK